MRIHYFYALIVFLFLSGCGNRSQKKETLQRDGSVSFKVMMDGLRTSLATYEQQLLMLRSEFRTADNVPEVDFFLFGMGNRTKWLYKDGKLLNAISGDLFREWEIKSEQIIPNEYAVILKTQDELEILIQEDHSGIYVIDQGQRLGIKGSEKNVKLPEFDGEQYAEILKVLNHEILVNIVDSKPVPNFFVYKKPWRRDAAMMAMCLEKTGNLDLIEEWVIGLDDPYDHNNGQKRDNPESEADNLGQTLYLLSLFSGEEHPLVQKIIDELPEYEVNDENGKYILGRSDFSEVPVYQTKWLIYGLDKLGIQHDYQIPDISDNYSSLFWWDYRDIHTKGNEWVDDKYPYIGWARDHFYREENNPVSNRNYPLTWETKASEADYIGMSIIDDIYVDLKTSAPHTWHAAEVFLYLLDN